MNAQQQAAVRAALPFCRDRIQIPAKGAMNYEDVARQIAALPDANRIKSLVAWVMDYERNEK